MILFCSLAMTAAAESDATAPAVTEEVSYIATNVIPYELKTSNFTSNGMDIQQNRYIWESVKNPEYNIRIEKIFQNGVLVGEREILEMNNLAYLYSDPAISSCAGNLELTSDVWDLQLIRSTHDVERFKKLLFNNSGNEVIIFSGYSEDYKKPACVA